LNLTIELLKSKHFIFILIGCLSLMLWVQEEFESVLKRKKIVGLSFIKISFYKKIFENNNLKRETKLKTIISGFRLIFTLIPIMLIPFSDKLILQNEEFQLGLLHVENSFILFILILIFNEIIRSLITEDSAMCEKNIIYFIIFLASFLFIGKFYSFDEILSFQYQYTTIGIRKYLIYLNPIGAIALFQIIINEIDNPSDSFDIVKVAQINCYLTLFIYSFLGGHSAPTVMNIFSNPLINIFVNTFAFLSKYIFVLVSIWVYRFVFVKRKKEILFNEF